MTMMGETMSDAAALNMAIMVQINYASCILHRAYLTLSQHFGQQLSRSGRSALRLPCIQLWIPTRRMTFYRVYKSDKPIPSSYI